MNVEMNNIQGYKSNTPSFGKVFSNPKLSEIAKPKTLKKIAYYKHACGDIRLADVHFYPKKIKYLFGLVQKDRLCATVSNELEGNCKHSKSFFETEIHFVNRMVYKMMRKHFDIIYSRIEHYGLETIFR